MSDPVTLLLGEVTTEAMIDHLVAGLGCQPAPVVEVDRTFLDTFDWRLWRAGLVLEHERIDDQAWLRLRRLGLPGALHQESCAVAPTMVCDLGPSELRQEIEGPIGIRALLPAAHTTGRAEGFRYLNRDGKTVARIVVQTYAVVDGPNGIAAPLAPAVSVVPVRGYPRPFARALEAVTDLVGSDPAPDALVRATAATERPAGSYSSAIDLDLTDVERADTAVRALVADVLASLVANQPGIESAIDTEFLHDYRSALRRLLVVLGAGVDLFPDVAVDDLLAEIRLLEELTSAARGHDIVLLALRDAPDELLALTARVIQRHAMVRAELLSAFASDRYSALLRHLAQLGASKVVVEADGSSASADPVAFATKRIAKTHRRLVKRGRKTADPDQVRPLAERLSDLLETFASVLDQDASGVITRELRRLLDVLDTLADLTVEIDVLRAAGLTLTDAEPRTLMAVGARIERLERARGAAERKFVKRCTALAAPRVAEAVVALDPSSSAS